MGAIERDAVARFSLALVTDRTGEARLLLPFEPAPRVVSFGTRFSCDTHNMSDEDLKAEVEKLRAENERLKSQRGRSVSLKVSEKGGVSVYGLGRFPVTLYKEQWTKLLAMADEIRAFLKEHDEELQAKPE
jgi:hypothetical protein